MTEFALITVYKCCECGAVLDENQEITEHSCKDKRTQKFEEKLIQEIGDEITKLRKENNELKTKLSSHVNYDKLDEYCKTKCNVVCKKSEKELKKGCTVKEFIDYLEI